MHMSRRQERSSEKVSRRGFFKTVAGSGAAVLAVAATAAVNQRRIDGVELADESSDPGYRESAHVRQYYRTLKI